MNINNSNIDTIMSELVKPEILYKSLNENNSYQLEELVEFGKTWNKIQQIDRRGGSICGMDGYICNKEGCNTCPNSKSNPTQANPTQSYPCVRA